MTIFKRKQTSIFALLLLAACGDGDGGASQPDVAICLYESAVCSYGQLGGECPPAESDYTTHCIDLSGSGGCVSAGQESEFDAEFGQTYNYYTVNPRVVEGVTCEDYAAMPELDPEQPPATCPYEHDGTCDVPGPCPSGTDVDDCAAPSCDREAPEADTCDAGVVGEVWCNNFAGGEACADDADIFVCDGSAWLRVSDAEATDACLDAGYSTYVGCAGAFAEFVAYCA